MYIVEMWCNAKKRNIQKEQEKKVNKQIKRMQSQHNVDGLVLKGVGDGNTII